MQVLYTASNLVCHIKRRTLPEGAQKQVAGKRIWLEQEGSSRRLETVRNGKLQDFYSWPHICRVMKSSRMRRPGHVARTTEGRNPCSVLVGESKGKRSLGRPRHRGRDSIGLGVM